VKVAKGALVYYSPSSLVGWSTATAPVAARQKIGMINFILTGGSGGGCIGMVALK